MSSADRKLHGLISRPARTACMCYAGLGEAPPLIPIAFISGGGSAFYGRVLDLHSTTGTVL